MTVMGEGAALTSSPSSSSSSSSSSRSAGAADGRGSNGNNRVTIHVPLDTAPPGTVAGPVHASASASASASAVDASNSKVTDGDHNRGNGSTNANGDNNGGNADGVADGHNYDNDLVIKSKSGKPYWDNSNVCSRWTFFWVNRILARGRSNKLGQNDLKLPEHMTVPVSHKQFTEAWEEELKKPNPSLWRAGISCFWRDIIITGILKAFWSGFLLLTSFYFVRTLTDFVGEKDPRPSPASRGYLLCMGLFLSCMGMCVFQQQMMAAANIMAARLRGALMTTIYRKAMKVENIQTQVSDVLNLYTTDVGRLSEGCTTFHLLWGGAAEIIGVCGLLISLVGNVGWVAAGMMALAVPIFLYIGTRISTLRETNIVAADRRVHIMQEVLSAIKLVKLYAYEKAFVSAVSKLRDEEIVAIRGGNWIKTINLVIVFLLPPFVAVIIFPLYLLSHATLPASLTATVLSLFNTARIPLVVLPRAIQNWAEVLHGVKRIEAFLLRPEVSHRSHKAVSPVDVGITLKDVDIGYVKDNRIEAHNALREELDRKADAKEAAELNQIELEEVKPQSATPVNLVASAQRNANAAAHDDNKKEEIVTVMRGVTMEVKAGETMAIVGPVGSGKSAIIDALLGEARTLRGNVSIRGSIGYLPQNPWIQAGTVRENILFGQPFNRERYQKVVEACALPADLAILPKGDLTVLSERGMNLSGGQRQRISLARAVYADAQVYLLDGPLSAVDWHTSNHIMQHCFKGMLSGKTIVLVTHQLHLLEQFDHIAVVKDRSVTYFGAYSSAVMMREFPEFQKENERVRAEMAANSGGSAAVSVADRKVNGNDEKQLASLSDKDKPVLFSAAKAFEDATLVASPMSSSGVVADKQADGDVAVTLPPSVDFKQTNPWKYWTTAGGFVAFCCAFHAFNWAQTTRIMSDWWISQWTANRYHFSNDTNLAVYASLVGLFGVFILVRGVLMYAYSVDTATVMHNTMYAKVLNAPFSFFTLNPLGGVLNAFSKDQDVIDETLPDTWHMTTIYANILMTTVILVAVSLPLYTAMIGVLIVCFVIATYFYLTTTIQLKEMVTDNQTPLLAQFTETLTGIAVVRSFDAQHRFQVVNQRMIDRAHATGFTLEQVQYWLGFRMDLLSEVLVFVSALLCVSYRETVSSSTTGLVIGNSLQMLLFFTWVVRGMADIASLMTSVQRVSNYIENTPQEAAAPVKADGTPVTPPEQWPARGGVEFKSVTMRYLPGAPAALKNVSFTIRAGEKIGVVGRTGSGKTSLVMALFRLVESEGRDASIVVDGETLQKYGLSDVRARMAIIPQEPVLFKGTIRSNLDPFSKATEQELWEALTLVHMDSIVRASPLGLDTIVEDNGHNFSLGQRQLMCLARAKLNPSRVLVLDEASSALDLQTDQLIQTAIKHAFKDRTVITIAHRLDTIIGSDRILGMAAGRVVEFDTPKNLLADPNSFFSKLLDQAGQYRDTLRAAVMQPHATAPAAAH